MLPVSKPGKVSLAYRGYLAVSVVLDIGTVKSDATPEPAQRLASRKNLAPAAA